MDNPSHRSTSAPPEPAAAPSPEYSSSGVDRSLIRWMLSLSPTERLLAVQQQVNAIQELRDDEDV